jgi:hypothetical protein
MEDESRRESSDMPSLGEWEPNPWCDVPSEKIFFNPWDNFFILKKYSQKQQTQVRVPSTLGVSISINRAGRRKTKACEEKKWAMKLARSTSLIGLNSQLKLTRKFSKHGRKRGRVSEA